MVDELALKFHSVRNISILFRQADKEDLFRVLLYFISVYPFTGLFISVHGEIFNKITLLSLMVFLRLKSAVTYLDEEDVWELDNDKLAERRVRGSTVLTPFDQTWLTEAIVTLAQLTRLLGKYKKVRMYSVGSYACENFFS